MDADLSLDVTAPSLGGGRREKIQEEGSDMDLKNRTSSILDDKIVQLFGYRSTDFVYSDCLFYNKI